MKIFQQISCVLRPRWSWVSNRHYASRNVLKLSDRGMFQDMFPHTAGKEIQDLLNKAPQCVYAGFDPTANSLHVGNLLVIINLLHWQRGGHNVIALKLTKWFTLTLCLMVGRGKLLTCFRAIRAKIITRRLALTGIAVENHDRWSDVTDAHAQGDCAAKARCELNTHAIPLGGATGQIGDPSGRSTDRVTLENETLQHNINCIKKNLETVFENHKKYFWDCDEHKLQPIRVVNNASWYKDLNAIQFVSEIGRNFRMGTMLLKQTVQTKLNSEVGMSFTEFTYQIFQSYDWLHLLKGYDCRFQIGGSDQMGNISAGHELISRTAKKSVYGLTLPLVTTEEGDKFGKSAGNALWLDPQKTSAYSLYQYFIRTKDSDVERLLKLFSFYSLGEIKDIMFKHKEHPDQRYPQTCLAEQLTKLVHGEAGLERALKATQAIYSKDVSSLVTLDSTEMEQVFTGASVVNLLLSPGITVLDLGMKAKCFPTESDAIRIIKAGGFYINHQRINKIDEAITQSAHILPNLISLLRVGKRNYYIVKWQT